MEIDIWVTVDTDIEKGPGQRFEVNVRINVEVLVGVGIRVDVEGACVSVVESHLFTTVNQLLSAMLALVAIVVAAKIVRAWAFC